MKRIAVTAFLSISGIMLSQNLKEYRTMLKSGENSERSAKLLIEKSTAAFEKTGEPLYGGFLAVGNFYMAKHAFNPLKKMSYFNEGKAKLENAVKADPKNLEIRLMRLITQENAPRILGYNQHIAEDRNFLIREYRNTPDSDLKVYIQQYLNL